MLNVQPHASTSCSVSDRTGWATVAYLSYLISDLYGPRSEPLNAICSFAVTVRPISWVIQHQSKELVGSGTANEICLLIDHRNTRDEDLQILMLFMTCIAQDTIAK